MSPSRRTATFPLHGRDAVLALWRGVFSGMRQVEFSTLHQAVDGEYVLEEAPWPRHAGAPARAHQERRGLRVRDGLITEWRDYTNRRSRGPCSDFAMLRHLLDR
jgi:limonene-1,2-epoxide hydrolase